jgi:hypothetical protein
MDARSGESSTIAGGHALKSLLKIKRSSQSEQSAIKRAKSKRKTAAAHKEALLTHAFEIFPKSEQTQKAKKKAQIL